MPKGKAGPKPDALDEPLEDQAPLEEQQSEPSSEIPVPQIYGCTACDFEGTFEEWSEHSSATGHTDPDIWDREDEEPEQAALFDTEGVVQRYVNVAVSADWLNEARLNMQRVVGEIIALEDRKKAFDADVNEQLKPLKEQLRGLDQALRRTIEQKAVDCEWRVSTEENARILVRLDTQEIIDRKPLTEEDRLQELSRVVNENREAAEKAEHETPAVQA